MVGSIERYFTRARAWPSFISGTGDSTSCRSPGASNPFGRFCSRSWRLVFDTLEGNIFVGDFRAAAGVTCATAVGIFGRRGMSLEVIAAGACCCAATAARCSAFGTAAEHAEAGRNNLCGCALLALFVLPFPRLNAAFEVEKRSLFQILLSDFGQFAPHDDLMPLGTLLALAVFVFVGFISGHRKIRDGLAAAGVARFGIAAQTADENYLIDGHGTPPKSAKIAREGGKGKSGGEKDRTAPGKSARRQKRAELTIIWSQPNAPLSLCEGRISPWTERKAAG